MEYNVNQEKLSSYTTKLSFNLYDAISSLAITKTISEMADKIDEDNFGYFFYYTQRHMINTIVLSLTKMFDTDSKSASVYGINCYVLRCSNYIPIIQLNTKDNFDFFDSTELSKITESSDLVAYMSRRINEMEELYTDDIKALKELRDRDIAHSDIREVKKTTQWEKIDVLLKFLREYLEILDWMLLSVARSSDDGESCEMLISDSKKPCRNLGRIFKQLGYIEKYTEIDAIQ